MKRFFTAAVFFAVLIAIWHFGREYMIRTDRWSAVLVPDPLSVWQYLVDSREDLLQALGVTTKRLLLGYFAGVILGIAAELRDP